MKVRSMVASVVIATIVTGGSASAANTPNRYHGPQDKPEWLTVPCEYEDSNNCYWNAGRRGNREGHSFWAIPIGQKKVAIVFWNERYNKRHGYITTK